ncbi:hypothetical protein ACA910_001759 [Epithemia clementina (nom. ined.)]
MIGPPGSSSARSKGSRRSAKVESPDDVIRQLQKLPANKKCADCSSKLPSCVNLTVGSFVCITCAGIHRELSQRVKGVGHSSFTEEEAAWMKSMDNEKVNLAWMANYNPRVERLKAPVDNSNPMQLKAWLRRKYYDKQWYAEPGSNAASQGAANEQQQAAPPQNKSRQTGASNQPQPTMVQMPPLGSQQQQPALDLFGGGAPSNQSPAPAPAADPFATNDDSFPADFGSSQTRTQQQPSFHDNSGQTNNTNNSFATFPPPEQQHQQQQPQQGFANFGAASTPTAQQQVQPTDQAAGGFANFPTQHPPQQEQGFASFPPQNQQMQPSQQQFAPQGQQQQFPPPAQQQQAQPGQPILQQPTPQQQPQQPQPVQNIASFHASPTPNHYQPQHQQQLPQPQQPHVQPFASFPPAANHPHGHVSVNSPTRQASPHVQQNQVQAGTNHHQPHQSHPPPPMPKIDHAALQQHGTTKPKQNTSKPEKFAFKEGQKVYYKTDGAVEIVKVHLDDELEPFYTIRLSNGKEKQTMGSHIHMENPIPGLLESVIKKLSETQLQSVYDFAVATLHNKEPAPASANRNTSQPSTAADSAFTGLDDMSPSTPGAGPKNEPAAASLSTTEPPKPQTITTHASPAAAAAAGGLNLDDPFAGLGPADNLSTVHSISGLSMENNPGSVTSPSITHVKELALEAASMSDQASQSGQSIAQTSQAAPMVQGKSELHNSNNTMANTMMQQGQSMMQSAQAGHGSISASDHASTVSHQHAQPNAQGQMNAYAQPNTQGQMNAHALPNSQGQMNAHAQPNQMGNQPNHLLGQQMPPQQVIYGNIPQQQQMPSGQQQMMPPPQGQTMPSQMPQMNGTNQGYQAHQGQLNMMQHGQMQPNQQQHPMPNQMPTQQMMQGLQGMQQKGQGATQGLPPQQFGQFGNSGGGAGGMMNGGYGGMPQNGGMIPQASNAGASHNGMQQQPNPYQQQPHHQGMYQQEQPNQQGMYQQQPNQQGMYQQQPNQQGMYQQQQQQQQQHQGLTNQQQTAPQDPFASF